MSSLYSRAPHAKGTPAVQPDAPNAALLIDFDNVTMGMRSDLSKELKNLLNSDIIKGKVTVQRAYADWRRYPQYIVPLSENSVDLIFAPAYGSSKKNATDIRMAIDGMELVFIRPEIGTFILLTGDSDFSSLVLKLKEYGKYVIGVGIQESSSDILVQNCDEYYSYTSLTGLKKTTDSANKPVDPWVLVEQAVQKMASRNDVMRSDRLKQVMMEIDATFDEGNFGFSKFSRFLSEAASRDLVELRKLENGQYEVRPKGATRDEGARNGGKDRSAPQKKPESRDRSAQGKSRERERQETKGSGKIAEPSEVPVSKSAAEMEGAGDPLQSAYGLLRKALESLAEGNGTGPVRDSDLKRKMLELDPGFDEGELGFGKFSRFLRQAHDHEVVDLEKREEGTYQVSIRSGSKMGEELEAQEAEEVEGTGSMAPEKATHRTEASPPSEPSDDDLPEEEFGKQKGVKGKPGKGLGPRRGERRRRRSDEGPPPLLEGQVLSLGGSPSQDEAPERGDTSAEGDPSQDSHRSLSSLDADLDPGRLGLPTDGSAIISYLTNSYRGVGKKTAESLVEAFGSDVFAVLKDEPERIEPIVTGKRAEQLLSAWEADFNRRAERSAREPTVSPGDPGPDAEAAEPDASPSDEEPGGGQQSALSRRRTRRGGRSRRG
ncbi:MAG: NYN domain-containing protein [Gemmatimonadota bacterium]|jgi:uncharacterized protein (TIGR00288 family)